MASLTFLDDPRGFLEVAGPHLAADPVVGSVVATVARRSADAHGSARSGDGVPYRWWLVVRDAAGRVVGAGMRTAQFAPYPLFVLPMPEDAALGLAQALHERGEEVGGVNGALPAARTCADEVARLGGGRAEVARHTRLHQLDGPHTLVTPRATAGRLRSATEDDLELVLAWFEAFARAADEQGGHEPGSHHVLVEDRDTMRRRVAGQEIWLWEGPGGEVVHLTAVHPAALGAARIGPVYTPPEHRGRGYAGATVATVAGQVLAAGAVPCLYTDQANPVSNALYARLGFRAVVDQVDLVLR
jgi:GNAT superfamily N-acetyltransferase